MSNPFYTAYPPPAVGHPGMQQPIATAPSPNISPLQPKGPMLPQGGSSTLSTTYPPSLDCLIALDYLFVNQKIELLQAFTGWETKNKYAITDIRGNPVFYVVEESGICSRLCLGSSRSCEFAIFDQDRQEVLRMTRPFRCDSCCCPCCLQLLEVYSRGVLFGSVTQEWSLWRPTFLIRDAAGNPVLTIKGPLFRCCFDVSFKVKSLDEKYQVGTIQKKWSGFGREFFTVSDFFGINFPRDLDMKIKAVLLGACLLLDFMYFEDAKGVDTCGDMCGCVSNMSDML